MADSPVDIQGVLERLLVPPPTVPLSALGQLTADSGFPARQLLEYVVEQRVAVLNLVATGDEGLRGLACTLAERLAAYFRGHNQFLHLELEQGIALEGLCRASLERLRATLLSGPKASDLVTRLAGVLEKHFQAVDRFVHGLWSGPAVAQAFVDCEPTCDEYSAALQLEVLGIDPTDLRQPVLDVGCGSQGALVEHLRQRGIEAVGIDLAAGGESPLFQADWMTYPFGEARWGTLIAHMSFTNHFVLHDRGADEQAERYGLTYMRMLRSLEVGGAFYYAPGVPFIERLLPSQFQVTRHPVASMAGPPKGTGPAARWHEVLFAVRVLRRR
jgi:hypothetical protein